MTCLGLINNSKYLFFNYFFFGNLRKFSWDCLNTRSSLSYTLLVYCIHQQKQGTSYQGIWFPFVIQNWYIHRKWQGQKIRKDLKVYWTTNYWLILLIIENFLVDCTQIYNIKSLMFSFLHLIKYPQIVNLLYSFLGCKKY